ncbi:MAG: phosphatase PAP2 family protein [Thermoanaerobaculia bacterium]|nr:phosphatase PAP2 family protein [Thermoanaerobaculia bacterium]
MFGWRHDALTPLFRGLTALGDATFFLVVFTLGYWLLDRLVFLRVSVVLMITALFNSLLKGVFQAPRPDISLRLVDAPGWSFPSAHAMIAGAIWPWLAREGKRGWLWPPAVLIVLGIATSRVYLGVHYPHDVAVGVLIGASMFLGLWWLADPAPDVWTELRWLQKVALVVVPVTSLLWVLPSAGDGDESVAAAGGALIGIVLGADWERRHVRFLPPVGWRKLAVGLVGLTVIFALRASLKALFGEIDLDPAFATALRYAAITLFLAALGPWLFVRFGWCGTEARGEDDASLHLETDGPRELA